MRLAVIDDDTADLAQVELDERVLVGTSRASETSGHAALMVAWATSACRPDGTRFRRNRSRRLATPLRDSEGGERRGVAAARDRPGCLRRSGRDCLRHVRRGDDEPPAGRCARRRDAPRARRTRNGRRPSHGPRDRQLRRLAARQPVARVRRPCQRPTSALRRSGRPVRRLVSLASRLGARSGPSRTEGRRCAGWLRGTTWRTRSRPAIGFFTLNRAALRPSQPASCCCSWGATPSCGCTRSTRSWRERSTRRTTRTGPRVVSRTRRTSCPSVRPRRSQRQDAATAG